MSTKPELMVYLEQEKNKLIAEFPNYEEATSELFERVHAFSNIDFEGLTDNRVYRYFLSSFKEIICFAFEIDVPKSYLRCFFKSLNNDIFIGYLGSYARSRSKDIRLIMERFLGFFVMSWQGYNDDKRKVLKDIVDLIDYWM